MPGHTIALLMVRIELKSVIKLKILYFLDLHQHMTESKIYEKQKFISEKNIRSLYRLLHLGIYQNKVLHEIS